MMETVEATMGTYKVGNISEKKYLEENDKN